jgi:hypothetical protein
MKDDHTRLEKDDLRPEYDAAALKGGVRGRYLERFEVDTDPRPEGYRDRRDDHASDAISVVIDEQPLDQVAVDDILPPEAAKAEGNGA